MAFLNNKFTAHFKRPQTIIIALIIITIAVTASAKLLNNNDKPEEAEILPTVKTALVSFDNGTNTAIETVGAIKPESQVEVTATTRGTLRNIFFQVGDEVAVNKILATLYDNANLTSLNNAKTNTLNTKSNLDATKRLSEEMINQANLGVQSAQETIVAAEIALESSETNYQNAKILKEKNNEDVKANAVIAFTSYLSTIDTSLDQINSIIDAEDNTALQLPGIKPVLGAKNKSTIDQAKISYNNAKLNYQILAKVSPSSNSITADMVNMIQTLTLLKTVVDDIIIVLDNTVSSADFTEASLSAQRTVFSTLLGTVVSIQTTAKTSLQALQNLDLFYNQEIDALANAIRSRESQLKSVETNYQNALVALSNAQGSKDQQILNSEAALDNAQGQLNLAYAQANDLSLRAPISGTITKKYAELGAEINPGQKIAQISQTKNLKIELSLPAQDVYRISLKSEVIIGDNLKGIISAIDPIADPITKKIKLEIFYNNKNNNLIAGTFISVIIPVKELSRANDNSFFIPLRAVIVSPSETYVFIAKEGIAHKISVVIGKTEGTMIEVLSGLNNGDKLVIEGNKTLEAGEKIKISNQ